MRWFHKYQDNQAVTAIILITRQEDKKMTEHVILVGALLYGKGSTDTKIGWRVSLAPIFNNTLRSTMQHQWESDGKVGVPVFFCSSSEIIDHEIKPEHLEGNNACDQIEWKWVQERNDTCLNVEWKHTAKHTFYKAEVFFNTILYLGAYLNRVDHVQ